MSWLELGLFIWVLFLSAAVLWIWVGHIQLSMAQIKQLSDDLEGVWVRSELSEELLWKAIQHYASRKYSGGQE